MKEYLYLVNPTIVQNIEIQFLLIVKNFPSTYLETILQIDLVLNFNSTVQPHSKEHFNKDTFHFVM